MQEYTVLPQIGIENGRDFWDEVAVEARKHKGEGIVTYMRLMLKKAHEAEFAVTPNVLAKLAKNIQYFQGVKTFFRRIDEYVKSNFRGVKVRHYIISAGLKEIIKGSSLAPNFHKVFACEYYYDEYDKAIFPNVIVNDTLKTQFIFRINKGKEELHESINTHMPEEERPIPFQNILYLGDGLTDVPCMTVIRKNGGAAIAVFDEYGSDGETECKSLLRKGIPPAEDDILDIGGKDANKNLSSDARHLLH